MAASENSSKTDSGTEDRQWVVYSNAVLLSRVRRLAKEGQVSELAACVRPHTALFTGISSVLLEAGSLSRLARRLGVDVAVLLAPIEPETASALYDRFVAEHAAKKRLDEAVKAKFRELRERGGNRPMTTRQADRLLARAAASVQAVA